MRLALQFNILIMKLFWHRDVAEFVCLFVVAELFLDIME